MRAETINPPQKPLARNLPIRTGSASALTAASLAGGVDRSAEPPTFSIRGYHGFPFSRPGRTLQHSPVASSNSGEAAIQDRVDNVTDAEVRSIRTTSLFNPSNLDSGELAILQAHPRSNGFRPQNIPASVRNDNTPGLHERIANVTYNEVRELRNLAITNPSALDSGDLSILAVETERLKEEQASGNGNLDSGDLTFIRYVIEGNPVPDEVIQGILHPVIGASAL